MTMDIEQQDREDMKMLSPRIACDSVQNSKTDLTMPQQTNQPSVKRSFDVAFLMLPDEKLKSKHPESKHARLQSDAVVTYHRSSQQQQQQQLQHLNSMVKSDEALRKLCEKRNHEALTNGLAAKNVSPINSLQINNNNNHSSNNNNSIDLVKHGRFFPQDLTFLSHDFVHRDHVPKSAFTKVPNVRQGDSPIQPAPSLSPGQLSCSSTSPPISASPPQNPLYQFRSDYQLINGGPFHTTISQMQQLAQSEKLRQQFAYRPPQQHHHQSGGGGGGGGGGGAGSSSSGSSGGSGNGSNDHSLPHASAYLPGGNFAFAAANAHPFVTQPDLSGIVRNPAAAAALLTTLIPPTIATSFSLTAQNVCAKCNISFRMTSDLVYHMRSHHKSEYAGDTNRRKREEKLKCPVCNESFRERHHLTRHMTAHNDKDSDETDHVQVQRRHK